ncbi:hypothetical protein QML37_30290 [Klebsiella pneumoniae]|uniref:hypothetical protein n=1 Tax=Klebsiella pneumoniae TaxID=573 RepID=UPI003A7F657F
MGVKKGIRVYELTKDIYSLRQEECTVAEYYALLKSKWEDLDYYSPNNWKCPEDQALHWQHAWHNRVFVFLARLNDEFENVRAQILNSEATDNIEEVYARVESDEKRRHVMQCG